MVIDTAGDLAGEDLAVLENHWGLFSRVMLYCNGQPCLLLKWVKSHEAGTGKSVIDSSKS